MNFLFDSSSIFEAILRRRFRLLSDNYTISLAKYEFGNLIWKRGFLRGRYSLRAAG